MDKAYLGFAALKMVAGQIKNIVAHIAARRVAQMHRTVLPLQLLHNFVSRNRSHVSSRSAGKNRLIPGLAPQIILHQRIP